MSPPFTDLPISLSSGLDLTKLTYHPIASDPSHLDGRISAFAFNLAKEQELFGAPRATEIAASGSYFQVSKLASRSTEGVEAMSGGNGRLVDEVFVRLGTV